MNIRSARIGINRLDSSLLIPTFTSHIFSLFIYIKKNYIKTTSIYINNTQQKDIYYEKLCVISMYCTYAICCKFLLAITYLHTQENASTICTGTCIH